jgi:hypothetical protein
MTLTLKGIIFALAALCFVFAYILTFPPLEAWRQRAIAAGLCLMAVGWMLWSGGK